MEAGLGHDRHGEAESADDEQDVIQRNLSGDAFEAEECTHDAASDEWAYHWEEPEGLEKNSQWSEDHW